MRRGWSAAFAAAALWLSCTVACAGDAEDATVMLFSGRDLWRNGAFAYGGFITAPGGFDDDGLMLKVLLSGGVYRYTAGDLDGAHVIGLEGTTQVLPGFRIKRFGVEAKIFFGLDVERHKLWPDDPGNRLKGTDLGVRIATSNSARLAYGWRVCEDMFEDGFYVGPEVQYFGAEGYRHLRFGIHITELKAENYEWSAALGLARDSDGVAGPYVRIGFNVRQ